MIKQADNPYHQDTPEWQLFENMKGLEMTAIAFTADSTRFLEKAASCRKKAEAYRVALEKLNNQSSPGFEENAS